jgi:hypothetical protein
MRALENRRIQKACTEKFMVTNSGIMIPPSTSHPTQAKYRKKRTLLIDIKYNLQQYNKPTSPTHRTNLM